MVSFNEAVVMDYSFDDSLVERVAFRRVKQHLEIVEPDPSWPEMFAVVKLSILTALGPNALEVVHSGSTSVPDLPAKPVIDIDLTVKNVTDEPSYVPQLEAAGFHFLLREPHWHQHRFFCGYEPQVNLHVWGPESPEVERHKVFRAWLLKSTEDRELYAKVKREAAAAANGAGETVMQYNLRKENMIREILKRALCDAGYIQ